MLSKKYLEMLALSSLLFGDNNLNESRLMNEKPEAATPPIPKGCKKYSFSDGFSCIALNQESANRKHKKATAQTVA